MLHFFPRPLSSLLLLLSCFAAAMPAITFNVSPPGGSRLCLTHMMPLRSGHAIPQLGFGTYRLSTTEAQAAVTYALDCGYRHIDCAKAYTNQRGVGAALSEALAARRVRREDLFVTSKLWPTDQHPDHVEAACRETMAELRLSYLDLYLVHWPVCWRHSTSFATDEDKYPKDVDGGPAVDRSVTLLDTWRAMSALVDKGLVRSIGLSNCGEDQIEHVCSDETLNSPVINQVEFHPAHWDYKLQGCHAMFGLTTAAYSPLAMPSRHTPPGFVPIVEDDTMKLLSDRIGYSVPRILLNWNADRGNVVIVRSSKKEHIKSNAKAACFTLNQATTTFLSNYKDAVRSFRTMNPVGFVEKDKPFFDDGHYDSKR